MPPRRRLIASLCAVFCSTPAIAFAQTRLSAPSVQLVSPGGPGAPTLTSACPTFSWAPGDGVVEYELAVFELDALSKPRSEPILHEAVSGRATSWTPAATKCLTPGRQFGWYMREIRQAGERPGTWTSALAFSVVDPAKLEDVQGANWDPQIKAPGNGGGGGTGNGGGNPNENIIIQLTRIEAMLIALTNKPAVSKETCFELGFEAAIGAGLEAKLKGAADGEAGLWAFGNGVKANINAAGEVKLGVEGKGNGTIKRAWCWDPLIQAARPVPGAKASASAPALSTDDIIARLAALTDQLHMGDDGLGEIMDQLPAFNSGDDGFLAFGSSSPIKTLANVLPLPGDMRTKLSNPGQLITNFTAQKNLCALNNLPDAIAGVIDNFCQLAADEPLKPLLHSVQGAVNGITTTVHTINTTLNSVRDTVNDIACTFFCRQN